MTSNPAQVIVTVEDGGEPQVHSTHVHHRDFPEIQSEGQSTAEAVERLAKCLALALEHAPSTWRQEGIQRAIEDVRAFVRQSQS